MTAVAGATGTVPDGSYTMPADFALIAVASPCPCGNYGDPSAECTCTPHMVAEHQRRVRGWIPFDEEVR